MGGRGLGCGTRVKLTTGSGLWVMRLASENIRSNEADTRKLGYAEFAIGQVWEAIRSFLKCNGKLLGSVKGLLELI